MPEEMLNIVGSASLPLSGKQREKLDRGSYADYFLADIGEEVEVERGQSYFGSGGYGASYHAAGEVRVDVQPFDNGCASGRRGRVTFLGPGVVSCLAVDFINDGRTFHNYIAVCGAGAIHGKKGGQES